jgi:RNA polymerase sigma factor (sigma-70 family)
MAGRPLSEIVRQLGRLNDLQGDLALPDAQLLERFVVTRDETAFTALMVRHGPMVLGVCRRLLPGGGDAEDAFQATFLVLVRKAGAISRRELLGNWLYGVAFRVASDLRAAARRHAHRRRDLDPDGLAAPQGPDSGELAALLAAELERLPARYRRPVVLCYLEGHTNEEAAQQLGWPVGTVKGRLSRARDLLRVRLARRGVALSAAAVVETFRANTVAGLPPALVIAATQAALGPTAAVTRRAAALATGVLRMMFRKRLKMVAALAAVLLGLAASLFAIYASSPGPDQSPDPKPAPPAQGKGPDQPPAAGRDKPRDDKDLLQGVWDVIAVQTGGKDQGRPATKIVWEFSGDRVFMTNGGLEVTGKLTLDPGKNPKTMDIVVTPAVALARDATLECVYQLDGDTLKICQAVEAPRPAALATRPGEQNLLYTLKRRAAAKGPAEGLRQRYGDKTVAILLGATKVEAFRLSRDDRVGPGKDDGKVKRFAGYAVTATAPGQGEKFAKKAAALLLDRNNFVLNMASKDEFVPDIGLRFWKGKDFAELTLCYREWSEVKVIFPDPVAQGVEFPSVDFGPGRKAFVELARQLFPRDREIQGLDETRTPFGDLKDPPPELRDRYGK